MNKDSISRQAAIDGFYEMASDMDHLCAVSDYVSFLESLPSVQEWLEHGTLTADIIDFVPVKKGHDTGESRWFHCSECGYGVFDVYLDDEQKYDLAYHYCPNCGAHMEGAEDAGREH